MFWRLVIVYLPVFLWTIRAKTHTLAPMFSECSDTVGCLPPAVCKFNICLPSEPPTPVYASKPNQQLSFNSQKAAGILSQALAQVPSKTAQEAALQAEIEKALQTPLNKIQFSQLARNLTKGHVDDDQLQAVLNQVLGAVNDRNHQGAVAQATANAHRIAQQSQLPMMASLMPQVIHTVRVTAALPGPLPATVAVPQPRPAPTLAPRPPPVPVMPATPLMPVAAACRPLCVGSARCVASRCLCPQPTIVYSVAYGCSLSASAPPNVATHILHPNPGIPSYQSASLVSVVPIHAHNPSVTQLPPPPQAVPGEPCTKAGTECTGGSICSNGACQCPPDLLQEGKVCVSRTVLHTYPPVAAPVPQGYPAAGAPPGLGYRPNRNKRINKD